MYCSIFKTFLLTVDRIKNKSVYPVEVSRMFSVSHQGGGPCAEVKAATWKVGDRGLAPHSGRQVSKKQNVSSPLTPNDSILWGTSGTKR